MLINKQDQWGQLQLIYNHREAVMGHFIQNERLFGVKLGKKLRKKKS